MIEIKLALSELVVEAYEDAGFVYDTKMSEFHGETMKLFEPEFEWIVREGRIKHLHLSDRGMSILIRFLTDLLSTGIRATARSRQPR